MADNTNNKGGFDNLKSFLITSAALGPVAIGLGLGAKAGFNTVRASRVLGDIATGGRPDHLEMIGRAVGTSRSSQIRQSLEAARRSGTSALQHGSRYTNLFAAAARTEGPQREAILRAYRTILNSPSLNLSETDIASEMEHLSTMRGQNNFHDELLARIEKRSLEVGPERSENFLKMLTETYRKTLQIEESITKMPLGTALNPGDIGNTHRVVNVEEIMSGSLNRKFGRDVKGQFEQLQRLLASSNLEGGFTIAEVTSGGSKGLFVSTKARGTSFDVPLALIRGKSTKGALGGQMVLNNTGNFSTNVSIPSRLDLQNRRIMSGEEVVMKELELTLGNYKDTMSEYEFKQLFMGSSGFKARVYDPGQFVTQGASEAAQTVASQRAWQVQVAGGEKAVETILQDSILKTLLSPYGVTQSQLPNNQGIGLLFQANSPWAGTMLRGANSNEDLAMAARIQQESKQFTVVKSNTPINFVSSIGWNSNSNLSYKDNLSDDAQRALAAAMGETKVSQVAVYNIKPDAGFRKDTGLFEGTSMSGKLHGHFSETKTLEVAGERSTSLMHYIANKKTRGNTLFLSAKRLEAARKQLGVKGKRSRLFLGYHPKTGAPIELPFSNRAMAGIEISFLENKIDTDFARRTGVTDALSNNYKISYRIQHRPTRFNKGHGAGSKGMITRGTKGQMAQQFVRTTSQRQADLTMNFIRSQNPNLKNAHQGLMITDAKHLLRSQRAVNLQMMTGGAIQLGALGASEGELRTFLSGAGSLTGNELARHIVSSLQTRGATSEDIAHVVASQHFRGIETGMSHLAEITRGAINPDELTRAIGGVKSIIGIETYTLGAHGQGVGKPAKLEKRSYQALIRHMQTLGASQEQMINMISDLTSRSLGSSEWESVLTHQTLKAAMKGESASLATWAQSVGANAPIVNKTIGELGTNLRSNEAFTQSMGINLKLETDQSKALAKEIFGSENIFIPGSQGIPNLSNMKVKRGGQQIDFPSEYHRSLQDMLNAVNDPLASASHQRLAMSNYKKQLSIAAETSMEDIALGKIKGSAQGIAASVNKLDFSSARHQRLMNMAKKEGMQSAFVSDMVFFNALKGLSDKSKKNQRELVSLAQKFLFDSEEAIHGMVTRHPTLGEGHVRFHRVHRAGTQFDAIDLLNISGVKSFLKRTTREKEITTDTLNRFLGGQLGGSNQRNQRKFASLLFSKTSEFMGDGAVYLPTLSGKVIVGGQAMTHTFSSFTQLVGDTDGDVVNLVLAHGKSNVSFLRDIVSKNKDSATWLKGEAEWVTMQNRIKQVIEGGAFAGVQLSGDMRTLQATLKEIRSKDVGRYSKSLDELRVGLLAYGQNDKLSRQGTAMLSILEEQLIKGSKKNSAATNIANLFATSIEKGDIDTALELVRQNAFGKNWNTSIAVDFSKHANLPEFMGTITSDIDMEAVLGEIKASHTELRRQGGQYGGALKRIRNRLERGGYDSVVQKIFESEVEGKHSFIGGIVSAITGGSMETMRPGVLASTVELGTEARNILMSRKALIPAGIGLGIGLMALNLAAPGYSPTPLSAPDESLSDGANKALNSGNVLSGFTNYVTGSQQPQQPSQYPDVSRNTVMQGNTYVEPDTGIRIESTINDISNLEPARKIIGAMNLKNNHVYIQDTRRPITKNTIDSIQED